MAALAILPATLKLQNSHPPDDMAELPAPSSYNETEIVHLMADIYSVMIRIDHLEEEEVVWAPLLGHELDLSKLPDE